MGGAGFRLAHGPHRLAPEGETEEDVAERLVRGGDSHLVARHLPALSELGKEVTHRLGLRRGAAREPHPGSVVLDRSREVGDGLPAARRDEPVLGEVRLEVVDLGQQRLGVALPREALREQRRRLGPKLGKCMDLEGRHGARTIPSLCVAEDADREPSSSWTTAPRATASCSSSTATTSPTARSSRCRRSSRRPTGSRRTRCSASRTCSSSCSPTTARRASPSRGTHDRCTAQRSPRPPTSSTRKAGGRCPTCCASSSRTFRPIVEAFGYRNLEFEGWEADDVIATLATRADAEGIRTCVVSTDRDAFQLCSENVCLMMTPRGVADVNVYTPERVEARYGVTPGAGAGLHRAEGRHVRQHPRRPRHRRQDRRAS